MALKRHAPQVRQYMKHLPFEADRCETAEDAATMMRQHEIHHVPVMSGSRLLGIVSEQDLLAARIRLGDNFSVTPLEQICSSNGLTVAPVDSVDQVVRGMLNLGVDSAAVIDGGFVVGIFTTTDALHFIADFCG